MEKTLVLIKPDAVAKNIIGKIISTYEENELFIEELKIVSPTKEILEKHYEEHKNKPFFSELVSSMSGKKVVAIVMRGEESIARVRKINGVTDPSKAAKGTIRHLYGTSIRYNAVHASADQEASEREIRIWFSS